MRIEKNGTRYFSFAELPGVKPVKKAKPTEQQKEKFGKIHLCKLCKQPMKWIEGTNICVCQNPACKGYKSKKASEEGEETRIDYSPSFHYLDEKGVQFAETIFGEVQV